MVPLSGSSAALPRRARLRRQPERKASLRGGRAAGPRSEMAPGAAPAPPGDLLLCLFRPERPPEGWPWELVGGSGGDAVVVPRSSGGAVFGCRPPGSTVRCTDAPVSFLPRGQQALRLPEGQHSMPPLRAEDSRGAWWRRRPQSDTAVRYSRSPTVPGSVLWAAPSRCQPGTGPETCAHPGAPRHS